VVVVLGILSPVPRVPFGHAVDFCMLCSMYLSCPGPQNSMFCLVSRCKSVVSPAVLGVLYVQILVNERPSTTLPGRFKMMLRSDTELTVIYFFSLP
jgi:hypothetical protein